MSSSSSLVPMVCFASCFMMGYGLLFDLLRAHTNGGACVLKKKQEGIGSADRVILDERVVSVSKLRAKARRANTLFWVAILITVIISGMVVPYMSMAAGGVAVSNSDAFSGEVIPGYSMGGISVGAYGIDLNEYSDVDGPTVTGSVYGYWDANRTGQAQSAISAVASDGEEDSTDTMSANEKAIAWNAITGKTNFSDSAPNGMNQSSQSAWYDTVTPYRTSEDNLAWNKLSMSDDINMTVSLYPDFVVLSCNEDGHACILSNPDDKTVSSDTSVAGTTAIPFYVALSTIYEEFGLTDITKDGEFVSLDTLMQAIADDMKTYTDLDGQTKQYSPKLDDIISDVSKNLLANTKGQEVVVHGGNEIDAVPDDSSDNAFNPYPYSMVFQRSDSSGMTVTSSVYAYNEAYVFFSPQSMYEAYANLKAETDSIVSQATDQVIQNDVVTMFQLGYYYAAMAICEAYLTEALPQDMTRGYVGPVENTNNPVYADKAASGQINTGDKSPFNSDDWNDPKTFSNVNYATLMYDVAHGVLVASDGDTAGLGESYFLGETNAVMDTLSVYGYSYSHTYTPGPNTAMDGHKVFGKNTAFTPYATSITNELGNASGPQCVPFDEDCAGYVTSSTATSLKKYTYGVYNAPYYPIQQHAMPETENAYRFQITADIPYQTLTSYISQYGLDKDSNDDERIELSYSSDSSPLDSFKAVDDYVNQASSLAAQMQQGMEDSGLYLQDFQQENSIALGTAKTPTSDSGDGGDEGNESEADGEADLDDTEEIQNRVDSALLNYSSDTMSSDNVHDLLDIVRGTPYIRYESFMRFYNPIKSEGGADDLFLTRTTPAATDYMPSILIGGYLPAGGTSNESIDASVLSAIKENPANGANYDYFSIPSFAACFAAHTKSDTYYGVLNYELRPFYKAGFLETLSSSASNVIVPQLEQYEDAKEQMDKAVAEEDISIDNMKRNITALYVLAKRLSAAEAYDEMSKLAGKSEKTYSAASFFGAFSTIGKDGKKVDGLDNKIWKDAVTTTLDEDIKNVFGDLISKGQNILSGWTGGAIPAADYSGTIMSDGSDFNDPVDAIRGKDVSGDKNVFVRDKIVSLAPSGSVEKASDLNYSIVGTFDEFNDENSQWIGPFQDGTYVMSSAPDDTFADSVAGTSLYVVGVPAYINDFTYDGSDEHPVFSIHQGVLINYYYNVFYNQYIGDSENPGKYYWANNNEIANWGITANEISDQVKTDGDGKEINNKYTVWVSTDSISFDAVSDLQKWVDENETKYKELCDEIFKDVVNLKQDIALFSSAMPSQMQNVLAWADFQNSTESRESMTQDPQNAISTGGSTQTNTNDENQEGGGIYSAAELESAGYELNLEAGTIEAVNTADIGSSGEAVSRNARMVAGVAGATDTSSGLLGAYTISAVTGRLNKMQELYDAGAIPYSGIVEGVMQDGAQQYQSLQSHVIDYDSIANGISGDLATRQRGSIVKLNEPELGIVADIKSAINNFAGFFTEFGVSLIRFTGGIFEDLMFNSVDASTGDVKDTENISAGAAGIGTALSSMTSNGVTTMTAGYTSNSANLNRQSASSEKFDYGSKSLVSSGMATAGAATTYIESMGSAGLLTSGYGLYSVIQSISLALVMVFLLVIAFQNFYGYAMGDQDLIVMSQMRLKTVLPRSIIAILMIGLPPIGGGLGFQGGGYLLLQFISGILRQISAVFSALSGGGLVDSWIELATAFAGDSMDIGALLMWTVCSLVMAVMFLIGSVVLIVQSLILLVFWIIGPVVWAFYVWPYGKDPNRNKPSDSYGQGLLGYITKKMGIGPWTKGAIGNAAPSGWMYSYISTGALTVIWTMMFWLMSIAIGTAGPGSFATSGAATMPSASAALFSLSDLPVVGDNGFLQVLLVTVLCVLIFYIMIRMIMNIFKNNALNATGLALAIGGGIMGGLRNIGGSAAKSIVTGGAHLAAGGAGAIRDGIRNRDEIIKQMKETASAVKEGGVKGLANTAAGALSNKTSEIARAASARKDQILSSSKQHIKQGINDAADALASVPGKMSTAANAFIDDPDAVLASAKDKIDNAGDKLRAARDKAMPAISQTRANVAAFMRNDIADSQRMSVYDMLDAHRIAKANHDINVNNNRLAAVNEASNAIAAIQGAKTQDDLNKAIGNLSDGARDMLVATGAISQAANGNWSKSDDNMFGATQRLMAQQSNLTAENRQLERAQDVANRSLTARHSHLVNGELVNDRATIQQAKERAQVYFDERAARNLDEFETVGALAAHYKQERDYAAGRLPRVNGETVAQAMAQMNELSLMSDPSRSYGRFDVNNAMAQYANALSGIVVDSNMSAAERNAAIVDTAARVGGAYGLNVLSASELLAYRQHMEQGGELTWQQARDVAFTEAVNAKQTGGAPRDVELNRSFDIDYLSSYNPVSSANSAKIVASQDTLRKRVDYENRLDRQFAVAGLDEAVSAIADDGTQETEFLKNEVRHAHSRTEAVNIVSSFYGDDRFDQAMLDSFIRAIDDSFANNITNNEDFCRTTADAVGIAYDVCKRSVDDVANETRNLIRSEQPRVILASAGTMSDKELDTVIGVIGTDFRPDVAHQKLSSKIDSDSEIAKLTESKLNQLQSELKDDNDELVSLKARMWAADGKERQVLEEKVKKKEAEISAKSDSVKELNGTLKKQNMAIAVLRSGLSAIDEHKDELTSALSDMFGRTRYKNDGRLMPDDGIIPTGESRMQRAARMTADNTPFTLGSSDTQDNNDITRNAARRSREAEQAHQRLERMQRQSNGTSNGAFRPGAINGNGAAANRGRRSGNGQQGRRGGNGQRRRS